jgi:hypothetical protein
MKMFGGSGVRGSEKDNPTTPAVSFPSFNSTHWTTSYDDHGDSCLFVRHHSLLGTLSHRKSWEEIPGSRGHAVGSPRVVLIARRMAKAALVSLPSYSWKHINCQFPDLMTGTQQFLFQSLRKHAFSFAPCTSPLGDPLRTFSIRSHHCRSLHRRECRGAERMV